MKDDLRVFSLVAAIGLVIVLPLALIWQYDGGSEAVASLAHEARLLVWVLVLGGLGLVAIGLTGWAVREIVRAWRIPAQLPPEKQVYRETRIIDGRPQALPMPTATASPWAEVWPELVRSGWSAPQVGQPAPAAQLDAPLSWPMPEPADLASFEVFEPARDWH